MMNAKSRVVLVMLSVVVGCGPIADESELKRERTGEDRSQLTVSCTGLDYQSCVASQYCMPRLEPCPLPACAPNDPSCPVCSPSYSCVPKVASHCAGLDERACNKTSGCQGIYVAPPCVPCADPAVCTCPAEEFDICVDDSYCSGGGGGAADAGSPSWPDAGYPNRPDAGPAQDGGSRY